MKHSRTGKYEKHSTNYARANLRNLFFAFAALFSLEVKVLEITNNNGNNRLPVELESKLFDEDFPFYTHLLGV